MPQGERESWNARYGSGTHGDHRPDPLLPFAFENYISALFPSGGRALDLAGGTGRQALWLAERGWSVELIDISDAGLAIARERARAARIPITLHEGDISNGLGRFRGRFDVVMNFFYLERAIFSDIVAALAPGALLIFKTYTEQHSLLSNKGPQDPGHLLKSGELLRAFQKLDVLYYREQMVERGTAELVARSPGL